METRGWGERLAPLNLILHLVVCLPLLGALTHHLVKVINETYTRGRLVARYARWVTVSYLVCFVLGAIIYPAFSFHVRHLYMDAAEARWGMLEAFVLAWASAFGAFGPIILFCGTTRHRTEVLSTSVFLEFSIGNLDRALVLSIWMGGLAALVLLVTRALGKRTVW